MLKSEQEICCHVIEVVLYIVDNCPPVNNITTRAPYSTEYKNADI